MAWAFVGFHGYGFLAASLGVSLLAGCADEPRCRPVAGLTVCGHANSAVELVRWPSQRYPPPIGISVVGETAVVVEPSQVVIVDLDRRMVRATMSAGPGARFVAYAERDARVYVVLAQDARFDVPAPATWSIGEVAPGGASLTWRVSTWLPLDRLSVDADTAYGLACTTDTNCIVQRLPLDGSGSSVATLDRPATEASAIVAGSEGVEYVSGTSRGAMLVRLGPDDLSVIATAPLAWTASGTSAGLPSGPFRVGADSFVGLAGLSQPAGIASFGVPTLGAPTWLADEHGDLVRVNASRLVGHASTLYVGCEASTSGPAGDSVFGVIRYDRATARIESVVRGECPPMALTDDTLYLASTIVECGPGTWGCDAAAVFTGLVRVPR